MLHLRPNQALHWHAMRYWKARGVILHDWGGTGAYKQNYGTTPYCYIRQFKSAVPWLDRVRGPALRSYKPLRAWRSKLGRPSSRERVGDDGKISGSTVTKKKT